MLNIKFKLRFYENAGKLTGKCLESKKKFGSWTFQRTTVELYPINKDISQVGYKEAFLLK